MSYHYLDIRFLWLVGAVMCVFCSVGLAAVGAVVGLPLYLAVAAGLAYETAIRIFIYSSPIWLPIGVGMGLVATRSLVRGIRRDDPPQESQLP